MLATKRGEKLLPCRQRPAEKSRQTGMIKHLKLLSSVLKNVRHYQRYHSAMCHDKNTTAQFFMFCHDLFLAFVLSD